MTNGEATGVRAKEGKEIVGDDGRWRQEQPITAQQNGDPSLHSAMDRGNDGGRAVELLQAVANNTGLSHNINRPKVDENDNNRVGKCESRRRRT